VKGTLSEKIHCYDSILTWHIGPPLYLVVIFVFLISLYFSPLSSAVTDKSGLMTLISETEDSYLSVNDLAFILATHDFDATPKGDYVEVRLNDVVLKLVPNGSHPGLANVTIMS